ncbi:MAG TPA: GAF domain-containing protein [Bryobacteraceae bacterium]|nr:GAF domain-containing protein [Bryobacteraceae bacterium]
MILPLWSTWYADLTFSWLATQQPAILGVLAATLVVFRTFRERYLLLWILGWFVYLASRASAAAFGGGTSQAVVALGQGAFVVAVCLFAASVLNYTHSRRLLRQLVPAGGVLLAFAVLRALLWPDALVPRLLLEVAYRVIALAAALRLVRYRWARPEMGPWLMTLSLLFLRLDWPALDRYIPIGHMEIEVLLGLSMLVVVFDDSKMRTRRLGVINALTTTITRAQQHGPMMATALEELKALMDAKAAWFRLLDGSRMVITQQIGLSSDFLRGRVSVAMDDKFETTLSGTDPIVVRTARSARDVRDYLGREGFHHCVVVPVRGKNSVIGTLTLGVSKHTSYTPEEMEFLTTTAHQLGLAVENLRLLEQILRSHRQWTNTFDSIPDVILLHDSNFRIMKANQPLLRRLRRAPGDVVGNTCEACLPRENSKWSGCPYCRDGESFYEGSDPCFGGFSLVSSSSYTEQGGQQKGIIHVVRDVTERRVAEEKYRLLFAQVQEGVFVATPRGKLLDCNDAFVRMLGYASRDEALCLNLDSEVYASNEQRETFRREVERNNYVRNFEVTLRRKDGRLLTAVESSFATRDGKGRIERYQGFLLDVTEKKQAEDEIRRRNRELNALNALAMIASQSFDLDEILNLTLRQVISLMGAQAGSIYVSDLQDGTFRRRADWGQHSENATPGEVSFPEGFGELVTRSRTEVLTADYLPHLPVALAEFICADRPSAGIWVVLWGKDRALGMLGITSPEGRKYSSTDENLLVATGRQLATTIEKVRLYEETCRAYEDLRLTQEQLLQSEKMSAVGQLISGVAHELNNPLTAILGYAQLLESEKLSERCSDFVGKLYKQAQRTHRVVQNLLSFARQRKPEKQRVDLRKVLDETLALREYDLRVHRIQLEREIEPDLPVVTADPHQLEQVFLNIINNAVDAMLETSQGGKLKVSMRFRNGCLHTEFHDSGPGIKEPKKIFDPFYTTKSVGKGTGLGLSICYGIIKEHGGEISARNRPEGGACIEVRLPSAGWDATADKAPTAPRREMALEGRVLLVEDEEAVLEFERDVLAGAGAKVVTLTEVEEAKLRLQSETFDGVIMNGKMPGGWSAPAMHRWLSENCSGIEKHVLFTFSNVADEEVRAYLRQNHVPSLVKPFEIADLLFQARRLLQKAHAAAAG